MCVTTRPHPCNPLSTYLTSKDKQLFEKSQELESFDQQNHNAVPEYNDKTHNHNKNNFDDANIVKVTSYEEEALCTIKALCLPSTTPEAPVKRDIPSTSTIYPEGKEKIKLKTLFPIHLTGKSKDQKKPNLVSTSFTFPSCKVTLMNTLTLVVLSSCGYVLCKKCSDRFIKVDKVCLVCNKGCKEINSVSLEKGETGFAGHDEKLGAADFKHLGSGFGLGLIKPAAKT